jgi:nicotinamide riboside kinase
MYTLDIYFICKNQTGYQAMKRIGFVGVPGAGKSSVARGLAAQSYNKIGKVELVAEYARRFLTKYGPIDNVADQYKIMQKQVEWEDVIPTTETDVAITDSPVHMGFLYALEMRNPDSIKDTMYINDIFKRMSKINCPSRYDIIFHIPPLWKPTQDGIRLSQHFDDDWRSEADSKIHFIFKLFPPKHFISLTATTLKDRIAECFEHCAEVL